MANSLTFSLPWPPSVNSMWRTPHSGPLAGRTMLSRKGREYRLEAAARLQRQNVPRHALNGKISVFVMAHAPDRRARDLDNLNKAWADALQHAGVIENDSEIDDLHIIRGPIVLGGLLKITLSEIAATQTVGLFDHRRKELPRREKSTS